MAGKTIILYVAVEMGMDMGDVNCNVYEREAGYTMSYYMPPLT